MFSYQFTNKQMGFQAFSALQLSLIVCNNPQEQSPQISVNWKPKIIYFQSCNEMEQELPHCLTTLMKYSKFTHG
jgi:hypothetical protein